MIATFSQDNYSYMLGHYMVFLVHFHDRVFFWTGAIYSKMNFINLDAASGDRFSSSDLLLFSNASDKNIGIPTGFPGLTALLSWICPRYQYHFPMEGIFLFSAMLMRPMAYFYSLIRTGNKLILITVLMIISISTISFSEKLGWHEIKQWQCSIFILSLTMVVLRLIYWLGQASMSDENSAFPLVLTLSFAFLLSTYCKEYVDNYVVLSKI